jgi:hypothetical protein
MTKHKTPESNKSEGRHRLLFVGGVRGGFAADGGVKTTPIAVPNAAGESGWGLTRVIRGL